jgi:hypothetical protein
LRTELTGPLPSVDLNLVPNTEPAHPSQKKPRRTVVTVALGSVGSALWAWRLVLLGVGLYVVINAIAIALDPYFLRLTTYDWQYTTARIANYYTQDRPDILFMGTSRTTLGFNPVVANDEIERITGRSVRSLNLGITGGAIDVNELILKNVIQSDKQPSVIVYGVTEVELSALNETDLDRIPYSSFLLRPDDFWRYSGSTFDQRATFVLKQVCPLCRSTEAIRSGLSIAFNPDDPDHKTFAPGPAHQTPPENGFFDSGQKSAPPAALEFERQTYEAQLRPFRVNYDRLATFDMFLDLAKARGIQVVLVNMPVAPAFRQFWDGDDSIERYRALVQGIATDHDVPLIDLYTDAAGTFPADSFIDRNHLNSAGAAVLTRLVVDQSVAQALQGTEPVVDPATFYQAGYTQLELPATVQAGQIVDGSVTVENRSSRSWPAGEDFGDVRLSLRWRDTSGTQLDPVAVPEARASLRGAMSPGQQQQIRFNIRAPEMPGDYLLDVGLVYEGAHFFVDEGAPSLTPAIKVLPAA